MYGGPMTSPTNTLVRAGVLVWNQYTDWPAMRDAAVEAERLGYHSLWTWDHLYPILGSPDGPMLEGYMVLGGWSQVTSQVTLGLMVGANTFRNPALVAKMMTTIDHVSGGRAVLDIGAAWFETEHTGFGIPFGEGPPERLRWLAQALPIMKGMLEGSEPTVTEGVYRSHAVRNDPAPVQARLPILIGGSGRNVTLRLVAQYGDACNVGGTPASIADADAALVRHCEDLGRDERTIERTAGIGVPIIRDSRAEAQRVKASIFAHNGNAREWDDQPVGTPEDVMEHLASIVALGYHHLIAGFPAPYDEESMTRLVTEVRPPLEAMVRA